MSLAFVVNGHADVRDRRVRLPDDRRRVPYHTVLREADVMFFALVGPHLEHLAEFVGHQIAYLEAVGDLTEGELTPDDVIDEVLLRAYRAFDGTTDEQTSGGG